MPEVPSAAGAGRLDAPHPEGVVLMQLHCVLLDRVEEARPSRPRFELRIALEQLRPARRAVVEAVIVVVYQGPGKRPFRALLAQHVVLLRRQLFAPFSLAFNHLLRLRLGAAARFIWHKNLLLASTQLDAAHRKVSRFPCTSSSSRAG